MTVPVPVNIDPCEQLPALGLRKCIPIASRNDYRRSMLDIDYFGEKETSRESSDALCRLNKHQVLRITELIGIGSQSARPERQTHRPPSLDV